MPFWCRIPKTSVKGNCDTIERVGATLSITKRLRRSHYISSPLLISIVVEISVYHAHAQPIGQCIAVVCWGCTRRGLQRCREGVASNIEVFYLLRGFPWPSQRLGSYIKTMQDLKPRFKIKGRNSREFLVNYWVFIPLLSDGSPVACADDFKRTVGFSIGSCYLM